jgi:hypothetical protein
MSEVIAGLQVRTLTSGRPESPPNAGDGRGRIGADFGGRPVPNLLYPRANMKSRAAQFAAVCGIAASVAFGPTRLVAVQAPVVVADDASAKTWIGHAGEVEDYLRTAPIARTEKTSRGVTHPVRAFFEPGGLVESMTWKALPPGRPHGFYESYKSEIAAYELDKLLALDMVPPKVEREMDGTIGVAVMWVSPARSFADLGGVPRPPPQKFEAWNREIMRAKMFHNLIGDIDPNLGNWLVDPAWHVILIDHSRAFTDTIKLIHQMQRIDQPLWTRMSALSEDTLAGPMSRWLDRSQIRAVIDRRARMQKQIDALVREKGEAQVFVR